MLAALTTVGSSEGLAGGLNDSDMKMEPLRIAILCFRDSVVLKDSRAFSFSRVYSSYFVFKLAMSFSASDVLSRRSREEGVVRRRLSGSTPAGVCSER